MVMSWNLSAGYYSHIMTQTSGDEGLDDIKVELMGIGQILSIVCTTVLPGDVCIRVQ